LNGCDNSRGQPDGAVIGEDNRTAAPLLASAKLTRVLRSKDLGHHRPKEKHGEEEKEMASSPMQRRKARDERQALSMEDSEA
jgi:hypothetical protein